MLYFAVTLKCNHRRTLEQDAQIIQDGLDLIYAMNGITSEGKFPYRFEIQPNGIHNLHIHTMIGSERPINYGKIHTSMKNLDLHCRIEQVHSKNDATIWLKYCNKNNFDIAWQYAETTGSDCNKTCFFTMENDKVFERDYEQWLKEVIY